MIPEFEKYFPNINIKKEDNKMIISYNNFYLIFKDGKLHNDNQPAIIYPDQSKEWFYKGYFHNLNGPAKINKDGKQEYWILNKNYSLESFKNISRKIKLNSIINSNKINE